MSSWQAIYKTTQEHQAQIVKDVLENSGINAIIFNMQDQAHKFGDIEVRVNPDSVIRAIRLIQEIEFIK